MQRRRFKNILSFPDRLDQEIERLPGRKTEKLPQGNHERDMLLRQGLTSRVSPAHQRLAFVPRTSNAKVRSPHLAASLGAWTGGGIGNSNCRSKPNRFAILASYSHLSESSAISCTRPGGLLSAIVPISFRN